MRAFLLVCFLLLSGCGYKPASKIAASVLVEKVLVDVQISVKDPKNSVLIKDAFKDALINRLHVKVVSKDEADTFIDARLNSVSFSAIIYDQDGYATSYKTTVSIAIKTTYKDKKVENITVSGKYDFTIESNSIISDTKRFEAIKNASEDALDEYVATVSMKGMQNVKHDK